MVLSTRMKSNKTLSNTQKLIIARIIPIALLLQGIGIASWGFYNVSLAKASEHWPTEPGEITTSIVEEKKETGKDPVYHAEIKYKFTINDTTYSGSRVSFGDYGSSNPDHANHLVKSYPEGKVINVYYKPGNPETCLLEPGFTAFIWLLPGIGTVFFLAGCITLIILPKVIYKNRDRRKISD